MLLLTAPPTPHHYLLSLHDALPIFALELAQPLDATLPQRDQIGPALVALEQALERLLELDVVGRQRQEPLLVADRLLRLVRSEEHTSELQSRGHLVCRLLLEKKKNE